MVGGGANINGNGSAGTWIASITSSYPSDPNTWTAIATVVYFHAGGATPTVTAYALCSS
jgi:hypothetical protein